MLPAGKFRHGDHRFEWSREQFRSWANGIAERFGYNVEIKPVADEDPQVGSPTQMGVSTRGNLLAYLTTEVARTIGRFVHRVTVIWASRLIGAPAQHPSFPVPAQPPREAMLDDQCGAEPLCVRLDTSHSLALEVSGLKRKQFLRCERERPVWLSYLLSRGSPLRDASCEAGTAASA